MTIYNKTKVKIVSEPCGRGKTYALGSVIQKTLYKRNHLILAPTLDLIAEMKSDLEEKHGIQSVIEITSNTSNSVRKTAIEYFKSAEDTGHVLLMTWLGYQDLPYFNRRENWDVYIDEIPQIDEFLPFTIPFNNKKILDYVEIGEPVNEVLAKVKVKDGLEKELQKIIDKPFDQVNSSFDGLYKAILSDSRDVFVDLESWNRVFEREEIDHSTNICDEKKSRNRVFFLSMMKPHEWNDVTLMGANIEASMLFNWFSNYHDVQFRNNHEIISDLRKDKNSTSLGGRLNVSYFLNDRGFSKYFGNKELPDSKHTVLSAMDHAVINEFGDQDILYVCNNDYVSVEFDGLANIKKIPVIAHGLNIYEKYTNIYFSAALNRETAHIRMLNNLGFDSHMIRTATAHEVIYQSVMRTALRNPNSTEMVNVVVPDEYSADRLIEIFNGGNKERIGDADGFKKYAPLNQQDRNKRSHFTKEIYNIFNKGNDTVSARSSLETDMMNTRSSHSSVNTSCFSQEMQNERKLLPISLIKKNSNQNQSKKATQLRIVLLTFHKDKYAIDESDFVVEERELLDFVRLMKEASKVKRKSKDESIMVNSTLFDPSINSDGYRLQENFVQSALMILDFDNGDLSPEEFEQIFWHEAGKENKRSFIICNSFSRSEEEPNKYRVFMFYKQPAKSLKEHQAVYDSIVQRLEANGYTESSSKLDPACRTGNQSFYIPCTNRLYKDFAFFRKYGLDRTKDIERYGINPAVYVKTIIIPFERTIVRKVSSQNSAEIDIDQRINEIKSDVTMLKEGRRLPFYLAGVEMKKLGLSYPEIECHLEDLAFSIGKIKTKWVPDAIKSLKTYKDGFNRVNS